MVEVRPTIDVRAIPDPFEPYRRQQEHLRRLLENPTLKLLREQQERMRDMIDPPWQRQLREHQSRLAALLQAPGLRTVIRQPALWSAPLTPDVLDAIERHEISLAERVVAAEGEERTNPSLKEGNHGSGLRLGPSSSAA